MTHNVGIWIDHRRAIIVSTTEGVVTTKTLESEVDPHPRYSGFPQEGRGEKRYEAHHTERLHQYYDAVIGQMGHPGAVLILGPGEAKLELEARLSRASAATSRTVAVEAADALTEPQVVAHVNEYFRLAH